jgi:hypothetical protein
MWTFKMYSSNTKTTNELTASNNKSRQTIGEHLGNLKYLEIWNTCIMPCIYWSIAFLAHLAKGHVSFCHHLPSVVHHKLSHLNHLLWNPWTKLNQTWKGGSLSQCPTVSFIKICLICIIGINRLKEKFHRKTQNIR